MDDPNIKITKDASGANVCLLYDDSNESNEEIKKFDKQFNNGLMLG